MPKSNMPKVNTLFSYFTKSPPPSNGTKPSPPAEKVHRASANGSSPTESDKSKTPTASKTKPRLKTPKTSDSKSHSVKTSPFAVGDLLWTKLEGYPWWPSLVCNHPTQNHCYKKDSGEVHVQFFDDPPTRAWIRRKDVKRFTSKDKDDVPKIFNKKWKKGCEDAEKALSLSLDERMMLVVPHLPSDDESDMAQCKEELSDNIITDHQKLLKVKNSKDTEPQPKRRRILPVIDDDDDDSEEEYKPDPKKDLNDDSSASSGVESSEVSEEEESEPDSPVKKKRKRSDLNTTSSVKKTSIYIDKSSSLPSPSVSSKTKAKLSLFSSSDPSVTSNVNTDTGGKEWPHLKFDFLSEDKVRDFNKRLTSHLDYDPKTLHVPESFKEKLTPALRQWWEMKSKHYDTVLFFKVGKFYELYHMDAVTAVNELGVVFMKGEHAHAGFPEIAYGRYADTLIGKGYKVARIEQVETPAMMEIRCKNSGKKVTKFDKVVKREICRITTKGTKTCNFIDGETNECQNSYLLAVTEEAVEDVAGSETTYGICFVDTSIGKFHIGQFKDDRHRSRFRTLISHYTPSQILCEKGKLSIHTQQIINNSLAAVLKESLASKTEFLEATETLKALVEGKYFCKDGQDDSETIWPEALAAMLDEGDDIGLTAKEEYDMAIRALGACTWYLKLCKLELELLSMKNFAVYIPVDGQSNCTKSIDEVFPRHMVLDGVTLRNLDVVQNSIDGTLEGTLLARLDQCCTPFGKRLFRQWLCSPLCNPVSINDRLDAVKDLLDHADVVTDLVEVLKKLPDLERLLSRIHTQGSAQRSKVHPDSRAIFFEDVTYSKRKIDAFLAALSGFRDSTTSLSLFEKCRTNLKSKLLKSCVTLPEKGGKFPYLEDILDFFDNAFDHEKARKEGKIIPSKGVDEQYDNSSKKIKDIMRKVDDYLEEQQRAFGCKVTYVGTARNRFQIEVPDHAAKKASSKYELQGQRKGFKRYWTDTIKSLLRDLMDAEDERDSALRDIMRRIFANFDKHYHEWEACVQCLAILDVIVCFAKYSQSGEGCMIRPEIVSPQEGLQPFIKIRNGRHPCIVSTFSGDEFIPNDTVIGTEDNDEAGSNNGQSSACVVLVTGPNMGGKSTLMRQVGLIVIIAQMGCYVPAEECRLTPVDRIFTRLGASDRIMSGESTFFVELSETASILHHATKHSLVLVDELGRGTATYDGSAIACAVVKELATNLQCRTLFSTHYHSLVEEFSSNAFIRLGHMACMVENEDETDPTNETITFLYKFVSGACPKSYGFNAARLASIPDEVIKTGHAKAKKLEKMVEKVKQFRLLWNEASSSLEKLLELQSVH